MGRSMLLLCLAAACSAASGADAPRVDSEPSRTPAPAKVQWRGTVEASAVTHLRFPEVSARRLAAMAQANAARDARPRTPLQIGVGHVAAGGGRLELRWLEQAGGSRTAAVAITSPVAMGLRVGLHIDGLPAGAELRVRGSEYPLGEVVLVTAGEIAASRAANGLYWTPATDGETQTIEIHVPAGASVEAIRLAAPELSHLVTNSRRDFKILEKIGESGSCNVDTACRVDALGPSFVAAKNAVAHMVFDLFQADGASLGTYICTGTLLNDTDAATQVPLFLGADHCFAGGSSGIPAQDRQKVAATLVTYWNYEATACGSRVSTSRTILSGGADVLFHDVVTDAMLLRLRNPAPAAATFAGWDAAPLAPGTDVVAIHHPAGDAKKVSLGVHLPARSTASSHAAAWRVGTTEGGSSGSGLFTVGNDGQYRLRGGLHGGDATCASSGNLADRNNVDWYSRLDIVFPRLRQWLTPSASLRSNGSHPLNPR